MEVENELEALVETRLEVGIETLFPVNGAGGTLNGLEAVGLEAIGMEAMGLNTIGLEAMRLEAMGLEAMGAVVALR